MASILDNYTVEQLMRMPPQEAEALYFQAIEERRRQQMEIQARAEKDAKGSTSNDLMNTAGGLAGTIGGLYAANSILGGGAAAGGAAAGGAGAAGATGAAITGSAPAAPSLIGAGGATSGMTGATVGGTAAAAAPIAAGLYGAYRGYRMYDNLKDSEGGIKGAKQGLKEGIKPANLLAFGLLGAPQLGGLMGLFGHKSTKQHQADRDKKLMKKVSSYGDFHRQLQAGRDAENQASMQAAPDFVGKTDSGTWVNNRFKNSGNVSDLRAEDIWGAQSFFEKHGNDWLGKMTEDERRAEAQRALDSGAVSLSKGMTNVDWDKMAQSAQSGMTDRIGQATQKLPYSFQGPMGATPTAPSPTSSPIAQDLGRASTPQEGIRDLAYIVGRDGPGFSRDLSGIVGQTSDRPSLPDISGGMAQRIGEMTQAQPNGWWNTPGSTIATKKPSAEEKTNSSKIETIRKALQGLR